MEKKLQENVRRCKRNDIRNERIHLTAGLEIPHNFTNFEYLEHTRHISGLLFAYRVIYFLLTSEILALILVQVTRMSTHPQQTFYLNTFR